MYMYYMFISKLIINVYYILVFNIYFIKFIFKFFKKQFQFLDFLRITLLL